ncbi:NTPase/helicase [Galdieria sulphuraria]|uniref:NTPase/helicase n=1 Tax=Galdieria sulphuraria TaxID=130081 RepID=M2VRY0_GALSU|nr:NTPase/helicase [Galdieria sulphuraria]EME25846.1 NTPase/helicase [Galdieria sulphuraria]|eukprot:XP_005702366.1 NTPase/helicase [Galdieria sulphuraria]
MKCKKPVNRATWVSLLGKSHKSFDIFFADDFLRQERLSWTWYYNRYMEERRQALEDEFIRPSLVASAFNKKRHIPPFHFFCPCSSVVGKSGACTGCRKLYCILCQDEWNPSHVCKKESLESVKILKSTCTPCPGCGVWISKDEGCERIWCRFCGVVFYFNTGKPAMSFPFWNSYVQPRLLSEEKKQPPPEIVEFMRRASFLTFM